MKKRFLAILAAASMVAATMTTVSVSASDFEPKEYTIAIPCSESGASFFTVLHANNTKLMEMTNGTLINDYRDMTPDAVLSFVEAQCAAGVDGLLVCPPTDSILPTVAQLCEEAGVYWGIYLRSITDPEIKEMVESSPYYIGNCYEDEVAAGYEAGKFMGEQGYEKVAIFSQPKGDTTTDTREAGLAEACEEYGIEIVGESRGPAQASDIVSATESFLAANEDLDAIFCVGMGIPGGHEQIVETIQKAGRDVKFVTIDFPEKMVEDFESGTLVYAYGQVNLMFDTFIEITKLVNAVQGYPLEEDRPTSNYMNMVTLTSTEAAKEFSEVAGNPEYIFFTDDQLENELLKWNNPDLNEATLQEIVNNYEVTAK